MRCLYIYIHIGVVLANMKVWLQEAHAAVIVAAVEL